MTDYYNSYKINIVECRIKGHTLFEQIDDLFRWNGKVWESSTPLNFRRNKIYLVFVTNSYSDSIISTLFSSYYSGNTKSLSLNNNLISETFNVIPSSTPTITAKDKNTFQVEVEFFT